MLRSMSVIFLTYTYTLISFVFPIQVQISLYFTLPPPVLIGCLPPFRCDHPFFLSYLTLFRWYLPVFRWHPSVFYWFTPVFRWYFHCIPFISLCISFISPSIPLISLCIQLIYPRIPLKSPNIALISPYITLISHTIPFISQNIPLISPCIPLISLQKHYNRKVWDLCPPVIHFYIALIYSSEALYPISHTLPFLPSPSLARRCSPWMGLYWMRVNAVNIGWRCLYTFKD